MPFPSSRKEAFTLVELIVVVTVISILSGVVFIAVDPAKRFHSAKNAARWSDINSIAQAIKQYQADNKGDMPSTAVAIDAVPGSVQLIGENVGSCSVACADKTLPATNCGLNSLDNDLQAYLKKMPKDPTTGTDNNTRYYVNRDSGVLTVGACDPEGEGAGGSAPVLSPTMNQVTSANMGTYSNGAYTYNLPANGWTGGFMSAAGYDRLAQRTFEWVIETTAPSNPTTQADHVMIGWGNGSLAGSNYNNLRHAWYFSKSAGTTQYFLYIYEDGTYRGHFATPVWGDIVSGRIVLKATGADYYYKINNGAWTLAYTGTYSSATPLYPSIAPYSGRWRISGLALTGPGLAAVPTMEVSR